MIIIHNFVQTILCVSLSYSNYCSVGKERVTKGTIPAGIDWFFEEPIK